MVVCAIEEKMVYSFFSIFVTVRTVGSIGMTDFMEVLIECYMPCPQLQKY